MSKKELSRRYKFSDAMLKQKATEFLALLNRDISLLSARGFSATRQAEYEAAMQEFYNFPSDMQLESAKMIKSEEKAIARQDLEQKLRDIQFMAKMAFYDKPAYIRAFGESDLTRQTDADLVQTGLEAMQALSKYNSQLADEGLTNTVIQEFVAAHGLFQQAYQDQQTAINERDISTNERVDLGNKLYDLIVKYAMLGQNVWESKDEAKYNDYVIYDAPSVDEPTTPDTVI